MALFHLSVTQTKRSAGQSAVASAAYPDLLKVDDALATVDDFVSSKLG